MKICPIQPVLAIVLALSSFGNAWALTTTISGALSAGNPQQSVDQISGAALSATLSDSTSNGSGTASAAASARAGNGYVAASVAGSATSSNGFFSSGAAIYARSEDSFVLDVLDNKNSNDGQPYTFTVPFYVSGTYSSDGSVGGNWTDSFGANAGYEAWARVTTPLTNCCGAEWQRGGSAQRTEGAGNGSYIQRTYNPGSTQQRDPGTWYVTFSANSGDTIYIDLYLRVFQDSVAAGIASASGDASFGHTALWGGISSVTYADGSALDGSVTALSASGFNYVNSVPEPETYALLLAGLGVLGWVGRRRKAS